MGYDYEVAYKKVQKMWSRIPYHECKEQHC